MGLKKHIKYQWRLLLPLLLLVWLIVIVLGVWMFHTEKKLKVEKLRTQITLVNSRIVAAYDSNTDPSDFLDFIKDYYRQNPVYDDIRMSVYHTGTLIYQIGEPIQVPETRDFKTGGITNTADTQFDTNESRRESNFYYDVLQSRDHKLLVYTMLPFSPEVVAASSASKSIYVILISVAILATFMALVIAHRIGKNISMLRDFAMRAGSDPTFVPSMAFPRDEIGDIARQIVKFYNERSASIIKLKREHKVAMHALEEKTRLKRELTNNINHELKTPIGVIKGYLDTINEHPDMDEESRRHFMQKVGEHVNRLTQLLDDLSSITRLEYGSKMINTEPVDFHEVVFQAVSDLETSGILGQMVFNYDIPTYCRVIGNNGPLIAMINNLAKNAASYSKGTECNLILTDKDDEFFYFAFYDNGVGVKESSLPHLFERFFREDSGRSRKKGGTGLGLCIVQNTIEALGGAITASNREGGGLLFRFTLKRYIPNA